jgi:hypothetical protein
MELCWLLPSLVAPPSTSIYILNYTSLNMKNYLFLNQLILSFMRSVVKDIIKGRPWSIFKEERKETNKKKENNQTS